MPSSGALGPIATISFFWNLVGNGCFSHCPCSCGAGRFAAALPKRPPFPFFVDGTVYMSTVPEMKFALRSLNEAEHVTILATRVVGT